MKQKLLFSRAAFLCALAVCAGLLAGCAAKADSAASFDTADTAGGQAGLSVVCTLFPVYDLVRAVGGGAVDAALLVSPGMDAHGYAPTAADMTAAAGADLLLCVGGHADEWAAGILDNIGEVRTAALLDMVDGADALPDDHVWTSPRRCLELLEGVRALLTELDPDRAEAYAANAAACAARFAALDSGFAALAEQAGRSIVLGDKQPFGCLAADYGLTFASAYDGCTSDTEVSAERMAALTDLMRAEGTPVVFALELSDGGLRDTLAEATGAAAGTLYSGQAISPEDWDAGLTLADMLAFDLNAMKEALQ